MKLLLLAFFFFLSISLTLQAQSNGLMSEELVLNENSVSVAQDSTPLLPSKYLFTQQVLWGEKGSENRVFPLPFLPIIDHTSPSFICQLKGIEKGDSYRRDKTL